jgi:O-antigen/teichoic acid export membrane protein
MSEASPLSTGFFAGRGGRSVLRNLGWLLAGRGVQAVLSLFYLAFVTRALGVEGFGRFALITGAAQALSTLVAFQSWQLIVQYGVELVRKKDDVALARLFKGAVMLDLFSAALGAVTAVLILEIWGPALGISPTLKRATLIFAVVQVLTIRSTPLGILRLRDRFSLAAVADSTTAITRFLGAGILLFVHPTVQGFMVVWGLAEVLTAATYWTIVARGGDLRLMRSGKRLRLLVRDHPGIVGFALSSNATTTLALASKQAPLLIVGAVLGTAAAGGYRLGVQLAQALAKLSQLIARAAFPEVVRAVRGADPAQVRRLLMRATGAGAAAGLVILLVAIGLGKAVLELVAGREFGQAYPVLVLMAAAGAIEFVALPADTVTVARGEASTVLIIRCIGLVALGVVSAWAIGWRGEAGMAMGVLAGSMTSAALLIIVIGWRLRRVSHR